MKIYIDFWDATFCLHVLPTIVICNNYSGSWWRIGRVMVTFIKTRIEFIFD